MTADGTSHATAEAIARRLGIRQKLLFNLLATCGVTAQDGNPPVFDLLEVAHALDQLDEGDKTRLVASQRHVAGAKLYEGKFALLLPHAPQPKLQVAESLRPVTLATASAEPENLGLSAMDIGRRLKITPSRAKELVKRLVIPTTNQRRGAQQRWDQTVLEQRLRDSPAATALVRQWQQDLAGSMPVATKPRLKIATVPTRPNRRLLASEAQRQHLARLVTIADGVQVEVRTREEAPASATLYVGPTNSGKTYTALENLFAAYEAAGGQGLFVYAGPLRMLAYEVYQKMVARYPQADVGFLTGEEQINPAASLIACTVEMAPAAGDALVLDETHWIADHARGQNWTNLLLGATYRDYHILTAAEALPMIRDLVADAAQLTELNFTRKTPLVFGGGMKINDVPARSAVVCFSRKSVYATANLLEKAGKRVGVLYGALPLPVRKRQIERYLAGAYDIMVTTDVIGHGINLPIDNVIFAQSEKFDGLEVRPLHTWEVAQIAGRAGRFGLSTQGSVYHLQGRGWFTRDSALLREGTLAGAGTIPTDLRIERAVITPQLRDLHITQPEEIQPALEAWQAKAARLLAARNIAPSNLGDRFALLRALAEPRALDLEPRGGKSQWPVDLHTVWQLISGPYNAEGQTFQQVFNWLTLVNRGTSDVLSRHLQLLMRPLTEQVRAVGNGGGDQVAALENSVSGVGELKMAHIMFQPLGTLLLSELFEAEDRLNEAITNTLAALIRAGHYGSCRTCGAPTTPWFVYCEDCFHQRQLATA